MLNDAGLRIKKLGLMLRYMAQAKVPRSIQ
jgi:hypothetical protein